MQSTPGQAYLQGYAWAGPRVQNYFLARQVNGGPGFPACASRGQAGCGHAPDTKLLSER